MEMFIFCVGVVLLFFWGGGSSKILQVFCTLIKFAVCDWFMPVLFIGQCYSIFLSVTYCEQTSFQPFGALGFMASALLSAPPPIFFYSLYIRNTLWLYFISFIRKKNSHPSNSIYAVNCQCSMSGKFIYNWYKW